MAVTFRGPMTCKSFGLVLLITMGVLGGCTTTDGPDHKVTVDRISVKESKQNGEQDLTAAAEASGAKIAPYIKYGSDKLLNSPTRRVYSSSKGQYSLDFVNISIEDFASIVFKDMLHKNYILDNTIKGEVTVQTQGQIDEFQLLSIVESVLASKSAVLISRRDHYEMVPLSKAKNYSFKPELFSARNVKPGYRMVIVPVEYVNPDDLKPILESVAPGVGHLKIDKERRAVIVIGSEQEIANVVDAVKIFDVSWLESKSIALLPVANTEATLVKKEIDQILAGQSKETEIVVDTFERFNALLVVASRKGEVDAVKKWLEILDVEVPTADTQLFVYSVQNRKASELADILNGIFNEGAIGIGKSAEGDGNLTASSEVVTVTNKKAAKPSSTPASSDSALRIVADETNNSVIILARESEYKSISSAIKELDVLPLQVLIEVAIVEVTLSDELSYGVEWYLKHNGILDTYNSDATLDLNSGAGFGPVVPGFSFLLSGEGALVSAVFNTLASESKLNVVSSPSLMALDNHTATIRVGDQQPVQVSTAKSTNNDVLTQSIEYKNTGVLLSVTPRVNSGGLVTMELNQEVTDVGSIDDATGQRSFLQRNINSTVAVQNESTIILGGLITENTVNSESGIPGLRSIPLIGGLFSKTSTSKIKRELIVLITPKVIFDHKNASRITQEYAEKLELLKSSVQFRN